MQRLAIRGVGTVRINATRRYSLSNDTTFVENAQTMNMVETLLHEDKEKTEETISPLTESLFVHKFEHNKVPKYVPLTEFSDDPAKTVPRLQHGLNRTLFSPGVHYQSDPRTGRNNFDKSMNHIPHIDHLKMDKISSFTPSSRDNRLQDITSEINKRGKYVKFMSSTSSMTGLLMKFHSALSNGRPINTASFSSAFPSVSKFSMFSTIPTSVVVTPKDNEMYSVDADRSTDTEITLSILGNALELMLTKSPSQFKEYLTSSKQDPEVEASAYHYAKIGKFVVRSQLDAFHSQLPGKGTFDIKTRAVCAIRMDIAHTNHYPTNYEIHKTHGLMESFERELYDAARIVMFKYSLQARMGNMDGIFMAFHNMKKILGYQYLPLTSIDNYFFGPLRLPRYSDRVFQRASEDTQDQANTFNQNVLSTIVEDVGSKYQSKREVLSSRVADHEMKMSFAILSRVLTQITSDTKGKPFRMMVKKQRVEARASVDLESSSEKPSVKASVSNEEKPKYRPVELTFVVNVLENHQLENMQMLVNERYKEALEDLKEGTTMDRLKFLVKNRPKDKTEFYRLNKGILKSSQRRNGFFVYQVKFNHYFNGERCEDEFPFPDESFLDGKCKWDVSIEVNRVVDAHEKQRLYDAYYKEISNSAFRHGDNDTDVYADGGVILDREASELQNILRAHSAKALRRNSV